MFDKLKKIAAEAKEKAGPLAEQAKERATVLAAEAKEKAGPLAEQAKERATVLAAEAREKAGPLAEQAKERATELAGKAAPAVSQGIDKAAGSIDKATGGRYSEKIDKVQGVVHDTAHKVEEKANAASADSQASVAVPVEPVSPVIIPAEPVVVAEPVSEPVVVVEPQSEPIVDSSAFTPENENKP